MCSLKFFGIVHCFLFSICYLFYVVSFIYNDDRLMFNSHVEYVWLNKHVDIILHNNLKNSTYISLQIHVNTHSTLSPLFSRTLYKVTKHTSILAGILSSGFWCYPWVLHSYSEWRQISFLSLGPVDIRNQLSFIHLVATSLHLQIDFCCQHDIPKSFKPPLVSALSCFTSLAFYLLLGNLGSESCTWPFP